MTFGASCPWNLSTVVFYIWPGCSRFPCPRPATAQRAPVRFQCERDALRLRFATFFSLAEFVHRPNPGSAYPIFEVEYLSIVRRGDQNIIQSDRPPLSLSINPRRLGPQDLRHHLLNGLPLLRRRILIAAMFQGPIWQA